MIKDSGMALRYKMFSSYTDAGITIVMAALFIWAGHSFFTWAVGSANWEAVTANLKMLMVGALPTTSLSNAWILLALLCCVSGALAGARYRQASFTRVLAGSTWLAFALVYAIDLRVLATCLLCVACGFTTWAVLARVSSPAKYVALATMASVFVAYLLFHDIGTDNFGGLLLSAVATIVAVVLSIPLGVVLALGRQSRVALISTICTIYVEFIRSVPLLLVVYLIWIAVPLLAPNYSVSDLSRGLAGLVFFFAAYMAEYVRSGLQSVSRGQTDAARALGLSSVDVYRFVVLPQAMRTIIPSIVGHVLDIFNATPLLFIIGMTDFLRAGQLILASPTYLGKEVEVYLFLMAVYFAIGSLITYVARKLERDAAKGYRPN